MSSLRSTAISILILKFFGFHSSTASPLYYVPASVTWSTPFMFHTISTAATVSPTSTSDEPPRINASTLHGTKFDDTALVSRIEGWPRSIFAIAKQVAARFPEKVPKQITTINRSSSASAITASWILQR
jgi:hypothetical protein